MRFKTTTMLCLLVLVSLGTRASGNDITDDATYGLLARLQEQQKSTAIHRRAILEKSRGHNDVVHDIKKRFWGGGGVGAGATTKGGPNKKKKSKP